MRISEIKEQLTNLENVTFMLPNGSFVPRTFSRKVGLVTKNFIDCGKVNETVVNFQLWMLMILNTV
jgi:hypothetical protein